MGITLTDEDQDKLSGQAGDVLAMAMRIIVAVAEMQGAERLIGISSAHIDSCLYHGQAGLDFAQHLADSGSRVVVPTTLNVGSLDLRHPDRFRGDPDTGRAARALMDAYTLMGATPSWTCAPYQLPARPGFGEHLAWAESNAIVFANSVLGARTDRYGDFIDICAALTGRVPDAGLHRDENRLATVVFDVSPLRDELRRSPMFYPVLGHLIGSQAESHVPAVVGLSPEASEDDLKALGAAAASSGGIGIFHAVGVTPEADDLPTALGGRKPVRTFKVDRSWIRQARDDLSTFSEGMLDAVSIGTPHFSATQIANLARLVAGQQISDEMEFYVNTSRFALDEAAESGHVRVCEEAGVRFVVDTCTYVTSILSPSTRAVMTDSAKWAYYAPGNLGVEVAFGSLEECVASALAGKLVRDERDW